MALQNNYLAKYVPMHYLKYSSFIQFQSSQDLSQVELQTLMLQEDTSSQNLFQKVNLGARLHFA
jgi:hypothetical protein